MPIVPSRVCGRTHPLTRMILTSLRHWPLLLTSRIFSLMTNNNWPTLVLEEWQDTLATLHMWAQIVGKIRLRLAPLVNHWWNVPLYVSARGLTTTPMTYEDRIFEMEFDFLDHKLRIECSDGALKTFPLQ